MRYIMALASPDSLIELITLGDFRIWFQPKRTAPFLAPKAKTAIEKAQGRRSVREEVSALTCMKNNRWVR
jgi:hypothetical protein